MPSIEIRTSQNVVIEYPLASLRDRILAFMLDLMLFYFGYLSVLLVLYSMDIDVFSGWGLQVIALFTISGFLLYYVMFEIFTDGKTPGKKVMKIQVVRPDGRRPGVGDYSIRAIFLLIDFFLSSGVLGAMLIGSTSRAQRLGDLAAGTAVIAPGKSNAFRLDDLLSIANIDTYQPRYPAVKQLSDEDVLLLKQLLNRYRKWPNKGHREAMDLAVKVLRERLEIDPEGLSKEDFLKTVIRDYIVLTR